MNELKAIPIVDHTCLLGEGPVWDAWKNAIYWIDILNGIIHEYIPTRQTHRTIRVGQMIGSLAVCNNGNFIAALQHGFAFIDKQNGELRMMADPEEDLPGNRFNEGKCDPAGRFWAGTMALSEEIGAGNLYVLENDLKPLKMISGVSVSNGLAWSNDHQTLYYIDSPTRQVVAFDYNKNTGAISSRRTVIEISSDEGFPDGMTID